MTEPDDLDELLRAVAGRHRRRILFEVWERERGAGELADRLGLAPASVSEHLKVLRKTGLVTMRVNRTYRLYRACPARLHQLADLLVQAFPAVVRAQDSEETQEDTT
ncbi:winged helix-turn-helix domain-containing protein [Streptosporangium sp. NPDC002544]|uniref:ArsR/SmtB family transcription factor n=1 Tax=Streptosporangium sp. NPDC002544 TaxID=3154538 RepID=UPI00332A9682